ncbi:hypothetical protein dsx2_0412 [Desulfovibrio sp. X2]|uniref:Dickkopf N-terminal cysteine-rich domain-containing protein n=1 Tax=Desulfovibrio sp. X2 TaxID=941449 RepID=UPI000358C8BE|nr:Dickkopf N-terminal cysteine-rich domain-containing protein [Desulfovibrio sp. X2]EPR39838.1 hypothetical protein dsx2_0412 [Desulfovibrio sp. X2]
MRRAAPLLWTLLLLLLAVPAAGQSGPPVSNTPCRGSHECPNGEYCAVTDMTGTCRPLPRRRTPCKSNSDCGDRAWCDPLHLVCVPDAAKPPSWLGKPCDPDMESFCGSEATCCEVTGDFYCEIDCP